MIETHIGMYSNRRYQPVIPNECIDGTIIIIIIITGSCYSNSGNIDSHTCAFEIH